MSKEMEFFIYLLEYYAEYSNTTANLVLQKWNEKGITQAIYDNYWLYHTESIQNALEDIDSLLASS